MSSHLGFHILAASSPLEIADEKKQDDEIPIPSEEPKLLDSPDYMARAQWLRAAVLGANDGLVSVASLMIGIVAVNSSVKAMVVSGLAGLLAGACSMAIGEFVSVYAQYDIEVAEMERRRRESGGNDNTCEEEGLPNPLTAAGASALAFTTGALQPLLAVGFIKEWGVRLAVVGVVSRVGLAGFGAAEACWAAQKWGKSALRVLVGGRLAMLITYGVLSPLAFHTQLSSA